MAGESADSTEQRIRERMDSVPTEQQTSAHGKLPSDVESLTYQHNITYQEADVLFDRVAAGENLEDALAAIKARRVTYRKASVEEPAGSAFPEQI